MSTKTAEKIDLTEVVGNVTPIVAPSDVKGSPANVAADLDYKVREAFRTVLHGQDTLKRMIEEAKAAEVHKFMTDPATGKAYKSWTAYMANVIGTLGIEFKGLGKRDRSFVVAMLYGTGMNAKTIADATGISQATVTRDVQAGKASGEIAANVETENRDGSKSTGNKGGRPKAPEKTPAEKAETHVKALEGLLDQMSADELTEFKKSLTALGREVTKKAKKA